MGNKAKPCEGTWPPQGFVVAFDLDELQSI